MYIYIYIYIVILREFRRPISTRPNFDGNDFPKRAQWKAKLNKMEAETYQKGSPNRYQGSPKCARGLPKSLGETGREHVLEQFRLLTPLLSSLTPLGRFWLPLWRPLDFEGVPKSINFL